MEIEVCLQEIYLEFIKRSCPLDTNLATQILNKILS